MAARTSAAVVGLVALAAAGCAGKGDVSGSVTYQGKPLVYGTVLLVDHEGNIHQPGIQEDGSYSVKGVSPGEALVAVNSPNPAAPVITLPGGEQPSDPEDERRRAALRQKWFPIPEHYGDPNRSELKLEVKPGPNLHDLKLE
jgi:hypothetical protein